MLAVLAQAPSQSLHNHQSALKLQQNQDLFHSNVYRFCKYKAEHTFNRQSTQLVCVCMCVGGDWVDSIYIFDELWQMRLVFSALYSFPAITDNTIYTTEAQ